MNEFIKKLIERLEERKQLHERMISYESKNGTVTEEFQARKAVDVLDNAIEIVNQLAEEYGKDNNVTTNESVKGDLISRASLLEEMRKTEEEFEDAMTCPSWWTALNHIKNQPTAYNDGWIPCSLKLPDYLDNVLVCTKNGGRTIAHLKHTPIEWRDMYMNKIEDVIAWKYLDAPYQPKGE